MNDREKLVELINHVAEGHVVNLMQPGGAEALADHLLASGVTVQQWRDAKTDPPDHDLRVLVTVTANVDPKGSRMDTDRMKNGRWVSWGHYVSKWMPLPKEETK